MMQINIRGTRRNEWRVRFKRRGYAICNLGAFVMTALFAARWLWLETRISKNPQELFCWYSQSCPQYHLLSAANRHALAERLVQVSRSADPPNAYEKENNNRIDGPYDTKNISHIKLSSPMQSGLNLLKSLLGSGNLALPSAIAAFSASRKAIIPAIGLALVFNLLSAYGFVLISTICEATATSSYQDAWSSTVSPSSSWMPATAVLVKTWLACISYLMIIGDCTSKVLLPLGAPALLAGRTSVIMGLTSFLLLPLCCLKSMAPLAKFSVVGILSAFYCLFVIAFRCVSGTYVSGPLLAAAPHPPKFIPFEGSALMTAATPASTVLIATLAYAYTNHYSAPQFYTELEPDVSGSRTARMRKMTYTAFLGAWIFFSVVMACGFWTFGASSQGMILNNYALIDKLVVPARLALSVSMLASFPIVFASFKAGIRNTIGIPAERFQQCQPIAFTVILLLTIVLPALYLKDLGVLAAFSGAILASFIVYIAPSLMAVFARRRGLLNSKGCRSTLLESVLQFTLVPFGIVLALVGAVQALPKH